MENHNPAALASSAKKAYQAEDYSSAANSFALAAQAYKGQDDALMAAEMVNNQSVALLQSGDAQAALETVANTPHIFAAAGDPLREAMAHGNHAAALDALGRYQEAEDAYLQSAELLDAVGEKEMLAGVMQSLSKLQLRTGRQLQAVASMQAALKQDQRPGLRQRLLKKLLDVPFKYLSR